MASRLLLRAAGVRKVYHTAAGAVHALGGVDLELNAGESLALVGESGSGKTVLGEILAGLQRETSGGVERCGRCQMVFQNPYESLNPRLSIGSSVGEPLRFAGSVSAPDRRRRVEEALAEVGLTPPDLYAARFPHQCSGGELQRACIARALVARPDVVIADEPTTMLDVSIRAGILQIFDRLRRGHGVALLLISHDFASVRTSCDRVAVMYRGRIVESGTCGEVLFRPLHPYTEALLAAIPSPDPDHPVETAVRTAEDTVQVGRGCPFSPRCPQRQPLCLEREPHLIALEGSHESACLVRQIEAEPATPVPRSV